MAAMAISQGGTVEREDFAESEGAVSCTLTGIGFSMTRSLKMVSVVTVTWTGNGVFLWRSE